MSFNRQPRRAKLWQKLVLMLASLLVIVVALEIAYRTKLYVTVGHLPMGMATTYVATSASTSFADEEFGYTLRPNMHTVSLRVKDGQPVEFYERYTNELGNYGPPKPHYATAELKILVFGDSYTAVGGLDVWPTRLEQRLQDRLKTTTCVLNFARDGYGVPQMFDLAADKVPEFAPDYFLICFISDDLSRERLPSKRPPAEIPSSLLNTSITREWCEMILHSEKRDDPLLAELNRKFESYKAQAKPINYLTPVSSFLYNRLQWDDPFHHLPEKSFNPRMAIWDYADDARFVASLQRLKELAIPYTLIHLPEHREMKAGKYRLTSQQRALLRSLQRATDRQVISLLEFGQEIDQLDQLFQVPHDPHPTAKGLEFYATAVDRALSGISDERLRSEIEQ